MRPPTHVDYRLDHTQVTQKNIVPPTFNPIWCEENKNESKQTLTLTLWVDMTASEDVISRRDYKPAPRTIKKFKKILGRRRLSMDGW
jgi:hypothetical protein